MMDQGTVDMLVREKYGEKRSTDGRDWFIPEDVDLDGKSCWEHEKKRGSGSFADVLSFEGFQDRKGLCVKVAKIRHDAPASNKKVKMMMMYQNELGALVRATEASVSGVVRLEASTTWNKCPALVLGYHGEVTLKKVLCEGSYLLDLDSKMDIVGQLVQAALGLSSVAVAHHDITPDNIMVEEEPAGNGVSYRVTLVDLGTATILAEDGTSELPISFSFGYEDTQRTHTRLSLQNKEPSATGGRAKGFQSDMFSISMVAVDMFEKLMYFPLDSGVGRLAMGSLEENELFDLVENAGCNMWSERWDVAGVRDSAFMVRWRESSRYAPGKSALAEVPGPSSPEVQQQPQPQQPQQQQGHDLDFIRAVSGGGGVDGGMDNASGQVNAESNASGMAQAAAGPAAAVVQAAGDSPPAAAATGASSSSVGQPQKRERHGDREYMGQGCPKGRNTSVTELLGKSGLTEAERDECWTEPKRRDIEGVLGAGASISGPSAAAGSGNAATPENGPEESAEDVAIWVGSGPQEQYVGHGVSAGGGGICGRWSGGGGEDRDGKNDPGVVKVAAADQGNDGTALPATAAAAAAARPGEADENGLEGAKRNSTWGLVTGGIFGMGPGVGTSMSRSLAVAGISCASAPDGGLGARPIRIGAGSQEQDVGKGGSAGGVGVHNLSGGEGGEGGKGGEGRGGDNEPGVVEAAAADEGTNGTDPTAAAAGGAAARPGESGKRGLEGADGSKGRIPPTHGLIGKGLGVGKSASRFSSATEAAGTTAPEGGSGEHVEDMPIRLGSGPQEPGVGQGAFAGGGGGVGSFSSGGLGGRGDGSGGVGAVTVQSRSSFGWNAATAAAPVPSRSTVGWTAGARAAASAAAAAAAAVSTEPGEEAAGKGPGTGVAAGTESGEESAAAAGAGSAAESAAMSGSVAEVQEVPAGTGTGAEAATAKERYDHGTASAKRKRDVQEGGEDQSSPRSKRRDCGGGSGGVGGGIIEPAAAVPATVPAPTLQKRKMRPSTIRKTEESNKAQEARAKAKEDSNKVPKTRRTTAGARKRAAGTMERDGGAASKRSRRR